LQPAVFNHLEIIGEKTMQINFINANSIFYGKSLQKTKSSNISFGMNIEDPIEKVLLEDVEEMNTIIADKYRIITDKRPVLKSDEYVKEILNSEIVSECMNVIKKRSDFLKINEHYINGSQPKTTEYLKYIGSNEKGVGSINVEVVPTRTLNAIKSILQLYTRALFLEYMDIKGHYFY